MVVYRNRKVLFRILLLSAIICTRSITSFSQADDEQNFEHITITEGLTNNTITCLFEDHLGYLWIGTEAGLNRYDGYEIEKYYRSLADSNSLRGNRIKNIFEINNRYLFISTSTGLSIYDLQNNVFTNELLRLKGNEQFRGNQVSNIFQDRKKQIYISYDDRFDVFDSSFHYLFNLCELPNGSTLKNIPSQNIHQDSSGLIWIPRTPGSIHIFNPETKTVFNNLFNPDKLKVFDETGIYGFAIDEKSKHIYYSKWVSSLFRYDIKRNEKIIFSPEMVIYVCLPDDTSGNIWCSTGSSLVQLNMRNNSVKKFTHIPALPNSLGNGFHTCLLTDRQKNLWIGTVSGLNRLSLSKNPFQYLSESFKKFTGQNSIAINGINLTRNYGTWVSTFGHYFFRIDSTKKITQVIPDASLPESRFAWSVVETSDKTLWLTCDAGVYVYDEAKNLFKRPKNYPDSLNKSIKTLQMFEDSKGDLWFILQGTRGIVHNEKKSGHWEFFRYDLPEPNRLPLLKAHRISEDKNGNLWFYYDIQGLMMWNRNKKEFKVYGQENGIPFNPLGKEVNDVYAAEPDRVWVATEGYGLLNLNSSTGEYIQFTKEDGLPSDQLASITGDKYGFLWIGTQNGLSRFNPVKSEFLNFDISSGLPDISFIHHAEYDSVNDVLYFASADKVIYFNPLEVQPVKSIPNVRIRKVIVEGKEVSINSTGINTFGYNQNSAEFFFSAVDLVYGKNIQYAYLLEGVDKDWQYCGTRRSTSYATLPPGNYTFLVKAKNIDGVWSVKPAEFSFYIATPYWQQWWFIFVCAAAVTGIIYFIYRQRQERIQQLELMRARISRDLHDDIGSTLQSISVMSEIARMKTKSSNTELTPSIEKIGITSREMIEKMNDIVWAVNPKNDHFKNIIIHMRSFAGELLAGKDIALHFKTDPGLNAIKLSMEKRKSFFLIFKEAIHNSFKYSGAKNVNVEISKSNHSMKLIVEDNGRGFDPLLIEEGQGEVRNGLQNMKTRAGEIDGNLTITSVINKGTKIELSVKLN